MEHNLGLKSATLDGLLPLDVMLYRMKNEALPNGSMVTDDQLAAAIAAAPYIHPKLAAAVFKSEVEGLSAVKLALDYSLLEPHEWRKCWRDVLVRDDVGGRHTILGFETIQQPKHGSQTIRARSGRHPGTGDVIQGRCFTGLSCQAC